MIGSSSGKSSAASPRVRRRSRTDPRGARSFFSFSFLPPSRRPRPPLRPPLPSLSDLASDDSLSFLPSLSDSSFALCSRDCSLDSLDSPSPPSPSGRFFLRRRERPLFSELPSEPSEEASDGASDESESLDA